jgi:hypothetical protein
LTWTTEPSLYDIQVAIWKWFVYISGLDRISWADQMGKQLVHPYMSLNVMSHKALTMRPTLITILDSHDESFQILYEDKELTVSAEIHDHPKGQALLSEAPLNIMENMSRAALTLSSIDMLRLGTATNIALVNKTDIKCVDLQEGEWWEKVVYQEYTFRYRSTITESIDIIENVEATGTIKGAKEGDITVDINV